MTENPSTDFFMILSRVFLLPKTDFGMRTSFCDNFVSFAPILKIINVLETVGFALCIFSTFEFVADTLQFVADTLQFVADTLHRRYRDKIMKKSVLGFWRHPMISKLILANQLLYLSSRVLNIF